MINDVIRYSDSLAKPADSWPLSALACSPSSGTIAFFSRNYVVYRRNIVYQTEKKNALENNNFELWF